MRKPKTIVLLSGGIDSAACAHFLLDQGHALQALWINYKQQAAKVEATASAQIAAHLKIPYNKIQLTGFKGLGVGEHLGRNALFVFAALLFGGRKTQAVACGIHAGTTYYDCSTPFYSSIKGMLAEHTDGQTTFLAPFLEWSKAEIVEYFRKTGIPLSLTYSCEAGSVPPCGTCLSCKDRRALQC